MRGEPRRQRLEQLAPHHEEPAHRIAEVRRRGCVWPRPSRAGCPNAAGARGRLARSRPRQSACRSRDPRPARSSQACAAAGVSSCCRSASITAIAAAEEASMPSMHAPASPRRPMRRRQRTRASVRAISRTADAVPSGLLSSTKMISHRLPARASATRVTTSATFSASLKVGTTIESSGTLARSTCGSRLATGRLAVESRSCSMPAVTVPSHDPTNSPHAAADGNSTGCADPGYTVSKFRDSPTNPLTVGCRGRLRPPQRDTCDQDRRPSR